MPEPESNSVDNLAPIALADLLAAHELYLAAIGETTVEDFNRSLTLSVLAQWIARNLGAVDAQLRESIGADVASASELTLGNDGNSFTITGTTAVTSIGTKGIGTVVRLRFAGALTLTHHASDLVLPGAANITTAAGDIATFEEYAAGDWRLIAYQRASGLWMLNPMTTAGDLILGGTGGALTRLPKGTDGQVLKVVGGAVTWATDATGSGSGPQNKLDATADPTVNDDTGDGYEVGSLWVNITDDKIFICQDATGGAAVWERIDQDAGILNNLAATTDPGVGDDSGDGYAVGSLWINVTLDRVFTCADASLGAAVWEWTNEPAPAVRLDKLDATAAPTTGDDSGDGYSVGSLWVDVTADRAYVCVDATSTAAVWVRIDNASTGPLNKLDATAAPTTGDDTGDGYSVGSLWIDVTADRAYVCVDATSTAAVWLRIDNTTPFDPASPGAIGGTTPAAITCTTLTTGSTINIGDGANFNGTSYINFNLSSVNKLGIGGSGIYVYGNLDLPYGGLYIQFETARLSNPGSGIIQQGANAASPTNQTFKGPDASSGNTKGGNMKIAGGAGSGTGVQGDVELEGDIVLLDAGTRIDCDAPLGLKSYTYDTTPAPSPAGQTIRISNADSDSSSPLSYPSAMAMSDGSYFRYVADNSIVGDV